MSRLDEILERMRENLKAKEESRRRLEELAQKARIGSKQAIVLLHKGSKATAEERLNEARKNLDELGKLTRRYPEYSTHGAVTAAWEEYAEAKILKSLGDSGTYPEPGDIPLEFYILGLGDVVGELRRDILDDLRRDGFVDAEEKLRRMEEIYDVLISTEDASILLRELRRKVDVARSIIESTRGDLALEAGQRRLGDHIKELLEKLEGKSGKDGLD